MNVIVGLDDGLILILVYGHSTPCNHHSLEHVLGFALVSVLKHFILAKEFIKLRLGNLFLIMWID